MNIIKSLFVIVQLLGSILVNAQIQTFAPTSGTYALLDSTIKNVMQQMGLIKDVVATIAISNAGRILYKQVYAGDLLLNTNPTPDLAMRIGQCTKSFTKAAIKQLGYVNNKFNLDDSFYNYLSTGKNTIALAMPGKTLLDQQVSKIKISDLLNDTAGWDTTLLGWDPLYKMTTIAQQYKIVNRPTPAQIIAWMLSNYSLQRPLPAPSVPSDFGYLILGRIIEKAAEKPYINYLKTDLLQNSMPTLDLAQSQNVKQNEIQWYLNNNDPLSHYTSECNDQLIGYWIESMDSSGGLLASASDLCVFMSQFWLNGDKRQFGVKGQLFQQSGLLPSTLSIMYQHPSGIDCAFLINTRPANADVIAKNLINILGNLLQNLPPQ